MSFLNATELYRNMKLYLLVVQGPSLLINLTTELGKSEKSKQGRLCMALKISVLVNEALCL